MFSAITINKFLTGSERCFVSLFDVAEQFKAFAKLIVHCVRIVSNDIEAAAFLRAFRAERGDDNMAAVSKRTFHVSDIFSAVVRIGEKVKYGAVVPDIKTIGGQFGGRDVGFDPVDPPGTGPEPRSTVVDSPAGNIEDRHIDKAEIQQIVGQRGISATHIDDRCVFPHACTEDQFYGNFEVFAKPTYLFSRFSLVNVFPVVLSVGVSHKCLITPDHLSGTYHRPGRSRKPGTRSSFSKAKTGDNLTLSGPYIYNSPHPISLSGAITMNFLVRSASGQTRTVFARALAFVLLGLIVHAETFGSAHSHFSASARVDASRTMTAEGQGEYAIPDPVHFHTERQECLVCLFHQQLFNSIVHTAFFVAGPVSRTSGANGDKCSGSFCSFTSKPIARLSGRAPPRG